MYVQKKLRRKVSAAMAAVMVLGNSLNAAAAIPAAGERDVASPVTVTTAGYKADLDLETGSMVLSYTSDLNKTWSTTTGMSPGATMLMDSNNEAREADMTVDGAFDNENGKIGAAGIRMSGEVSGVKSWFLMDSGVFCLGAGLESDADGERIINVVENVPVTASLYLQLVQPNYAWRQISTAVTNDAQWKPAVNKPVLQDRANCNWLGIASSNSDNLEWHYIYNDGLVASNVYVRFPTDGGSNVTRFEMWVEPTGGTYAYTLGVKGNRSDGSIGTVGGTAVSPNTILKNTEDLQSVENLSEGIVAVNKWTAGQMDVNSSVVNLHLDQPVSVFLQKSNEDDKVTIILSALSTDTSSVIEVTADLEADSVTISDPTAVQSEVEDKTVSFTIDPAKMSGSVTAEIKLKTPDYVEGNSITMVRGETVRIALPAGMSGSNVTWSAKFEKSDGTYLRNSGYSSVKRELKDGEKDGTRSAGDTSAEHLIYMEKLSNGDLTLTAQQKGELVIVATDGTKTEKYHTTILYEDPDNLPEVTAEDYAQIRQTWKESIIGTDVASAEGGTEILEAVDQEAQAAWDAYEYKGQECTSAPWIEDTTVSGGNDALNFTDDAVRFRYSFQKVLSMAKAYSTEGSRYYQNVEMFQDMIHIMDYLCTECYTPKSQTDNWWTWEIGMPKDLIPILILLYDDLTQDQVMTYTEALYFFQPDPYHEGAVGTASTHANGYRVAEGANIIDCSTTAIGLGALRNDNEELYLGMLASSGTFVIQEVGDSTRLSTDGYVSGFYSDGSYLDHTYVPYTGSYGVEFMKGGVKIPSLISGTPWQYSDEVQKNLEHYIVAGFGSSIYRGMMLDSLMGRSVSRPAYSNRAAGREAMVIVLQMYMAGYLSDEAQETVLPAMKCWLEADPEFEDSLEGVEYIAVKRMAQEIRDDNSIESYVPSIHQTFPLMDRVVHRRDNYLFALSMFSERIQNTEIMNGENLLGWHQGDGMTYIYDGDDQYTDNYWNTVNPFRLAGTTVVPIDIGNGTPDSSGYLQGGDYLSTESWVGGSAIGDYGISGMSFSGAMGSNAGTGGTYAPNLRGKKSWFMFDDEIVCLGAGITNSGMNYLPVETIVENKKLREDGSNQLTINGEAVEVPTVETELEDYVIGCADVAGTKMNATWAHLEGNQTEGTGYYFPFENTKLNVRKTQTTGNWSDVGTFEGESTQNYIELWFDHGMNPKPTSPASYGYVLLPGKTADETADYAEDPKVTILENSTEAQAVYHEELGITGINFWENGEYTVDGVTCDKQASVMLWEDEDGLLKVAVSDPTMKNTGTIKVTINKQVDSEFDPELDNNVSCEIQENGSAVLTFRMKGTNGTSSMASLHLVPVKDIIQNALDLFDDPEADEEELEDAVKLAVDTVQEADNDTLVDTIIDIVIKLAEAYIEVYGLGERVDPVGSSVKKLNPRAKGMVLNISPDDAERDSVAVLRITGEDDEVVMTERKATSSTALRKTAASGLSMKANSVMTEEVATSSVAYRANTKIDVDEIDGKVLDEETICQFGLELYWEKQGDEDEDQDLESLTQKAPYEVTIDLPENMDPEGILAAIFVGKEEYPLSIVVDQEEGTLTFYPTRTGTVVLANAAEESEDPEDPEKPTPEDPENPTPEDPENPTPEDPENPTPENPENPTPEDPENPKPEDPAPEKPENPTPEDPENPTPENPETPDQDKPGQENPKPEDPEPERPSYQSRRSYSSSGSTKTSGWVQVNNQWKYQLPNGGYAANSWNNIDGQWYSFDVNGYMRTGWYFESQDGFWYYLKADGAMATGWLQIDGKWYYFNVSPGTATGWTLKNGVWEFQMPENPERPQGALYQSTVTPDGYQVDAQGSWIQ